jgi:hypothetical protein
MGKLVEGQSLCGRHRGASRLQAGTRARGEGHWKWRGVAAAALEHVVFVFCAAGGGRSNGVTYCSAGVLGVRKDCLHASQGKWAVVERVLEAWWMRRVCCVVSWCPSPILGGGLCVGQFPLIRQRTASSPSTQGVGAGVGVGVGRGLSPQTDSTP